MYRVNPLERNVLITFDEVLHHAPTKHALDPRTIEQHIIIAEERFIRPLLAHEYYEALATEKNLVITSGNLSAQQALLDASLGIQAQPVNLKAGMIVNALEYLSTDNKKLWTEYLWKLTAECVMLLAYPEAYLQFGTEGVHMTNPVASPMGNAGPTSPDLRTLKYALDKKLQDRVDPLMEAMHLFLCRQKKADSTKYPLYDKVCDCDTKVLLIKEKLTGY